MNEDSADAEVPVGQQKFHLIPVKLDYFQFPGVLVKESIDHEEHSRKGNFSKDQC